jgi:hypothetical protein
MLLNEVRVVTDPHTIQALKTYEYGVVPSWVGQYAPCYTTQVWPNPARGTGPTSGTAWPGPNTDRDWLR